MSDFKKKSVDFSLKDVGSQIIDQLSSDIYSGIGAILRELVKNAYDSYLSISSDELEDEECPRDIIISRDRDEDKVGRILISDHGIGQTIEELKSFVQISISKKQDDLEKATGFRGLGSWAALGAGSKITITSKKKESASEARLTLNVRKIYEIMSPSSTLDDVLNNPECILFAERETEDVTSHGTTIEIECDGEPTLVNGHELNRLYKFTDPQETELKKILTQTCPIPFSSEGGAHSKIHEIYDETGYIPTQIILGDESLERRLPTQLTEINLFDIHLANGQIAAKAWVAEDPKKSASIESYFKENVDLLNGSSIQLVKLNVPIGQKGLFSDKGRDFLLNWYVGEVHILINDVLPDASGEGLRAGTAREVFVEALKHFYIQLKERAEQKSRKLNNEKALRTGIDAANKLEEPNLHETEKAKLTLAVSNAIKVINETVQRGGAKEKSESKSNKTFNPQSVKNLRQEARKLFKTKGLLDKLDSTPKKQTKKSNNKTTSVKENLNKPQRVIDLEVFQARVGLAVPKLEEIGLSKEQISQVLEIIKEIAA